MGSSRSGRVPTPSEPGVDGLAIGVAQVASTVGEASTNVTAVGRYARLAARRRSDLVVFPECFVQGYSMERRHLTTAEAADGPSITAIRSHARNSGVAVVVGFLERNPDDARRPFSAAVLVDSRGELCGVYRKTHLYRPERARLSAGDGYPVFTARLGQSGRAVRVGLAICADVEYPEVARLLALAGAQLICVSSANMRPFEAQQSANLASRAIENNLFVALANAIGRVGENDFFGGSGIAGPAGSFRRAGYNRTRLVVAQLKQSEIDESGGTRSYLRGRRPETYRALVREPG